jgi:hypothetical protein
VLSYGLIIEQAPLQTYGAALVFSPAKSGVKHYSHPILPERLGALGWLASSKAPVGNGKVVEVDEEKPARASGADEL